MMMSLSNARWALSASLFALTLSLTACGGETSTAPTGTTSGTSPAAAPAGGGLAIKGAGATAPYPLYQKWFADYAKVNPAVQIGYESVGSGAGVKQFIAETVDFGATDSALKAEEKSQVPAKRGKAIQIPSTGLFVVLAYNLDGVTDLKLSRESFCGIVDGTITTWNDAKIAKDNAGAKLPSDPITFVTRSDGSGTTSIFTKHIEKACPGWKLGSGKSVDWPKSTGAKGNDGVTSAIQQTKGSIGYTEFSYAKENKLAMVTLQNKAGAFVTPSPDSAAKALSGVKMPDDFGLSVPDPEAKDAYPIVSLTWLLMYENYPDAAKVDALKGFVKWSAKEGKAAVVELGYIPLPDDISAKAVAAIDAIKVAK